MISSNMLDPATCSLLQPIYMGFWMYVAPETMQAIVNQKDIFSAPPIVAFINNVEYIICCKLSNTIIN
jgi:hypothetical protein